MRSPLLSIIRGRPIFVIRGIPIFVIRGTPIFVIRGIPIFVIRGMPIFVIRGIPIFVIRGIKNSTNTCILGKQLVNFIICGCESNAPFFVIYSPLAHSQKIGKTNNLRVFGSN
jgi:hypothetical protein